MEKEMVSEKIILRLKKRKILKTEMKSSLKSISLKKESVFKNEIDQEEK